MMWKHLLVVLFLLLASGVALATPIAPGQTGVTPAGNTVTNTGTAPIEAIANMVGGRELVEVTGDGAVVRLKAPHSDAEVDGNGNTVHHEASDTTSSTTGQPTTVTGASTSTVNKNAAGNTTTSNSRS